TQTPEHPASRSHAGGTPGRSAATPDPGGAAASRGITRTERLDVLDAEPTLAARSAERRDLAAALPVPHRGDGDTQQSGNLSDRQRCLSGVGIAIAHATESRYCYRTCQLV